MGVVPSHMGDMCVCVEYAVGSLRKAGGGHKHREAIPLALFDKCHGLFYMLTGTRDRQLNVRFAAAQSVLD